MHIWVFLLSWFVNTFYLLLFILTDAILLSLNIHVGFNIYLCKLHAHLCFAKFAPLNLHSLRRRRGCIVFSQGSTSSFLFMKHLFSLWFTNPWIRGRVYFTMYQIKRRNYFQYIISLIHPVKNSIVCTEWFMTIIDLPRMLSKRLSLDWWSWKEYSFLMCRSMIALCFVTILMNTRFLLNSCMFFNDDYKSI